MDVVEQVTISVDDVEVSTQTVAMQPGESKEIAIKIACPDTITKYNIQAIDKNIGLDTDYTPEDNTVSLELGHSNICVDSELQMVGENRILVTTIENKGSAEVSGRIKVSDINDNLLSEQVFLNIGSGEKAIVEYTVSGDLSDTSLYASAVTDTVEIYTYDNSDSVYIPFSEGGTDSKPDLDPNPGTGTEQNPEQGSGTEQNPNPGTGTEQNPEQGSGTETEQKPNPETHTHNYTEKINVATTKNNGSIQQVCTVCGDVEKSTPVYAVKKIVLSYSAVDYSGKGQKPAVKVTDTKGQKISNTYYTISYKNNKKIGTATVTIKLKGLYSGTLKKTFKIIPKSTNLQKMVAKKKGFMVVWKKQSSQTSGYQIQYSTSNKFTKKTTKTVTIQGTKKTKKSISKLKAKKKYYVRIRTYKNVKVGKKTAKVFSKWSGKKTVTTK